MSRRCEIPIFSLILFLAVLTGRPNDTHGSLSDELSKSIEDSGSSDGDTTTELRLDSSSVETDGETTTDFNVDSTTITTTGSWIDSDGDYHEEPPKLPVDLLSEDILLDPNVVLARVARNSDARRSSSEYRYRRPLRRTDYQERNNNRNYAINKRPIYPVFTGKK